jgi:hypothetical protein
VAAKPDIPTIKRILDVRDTRDRMEINDRWVSIPGTGQIRPCDRCCREHEIHVDVELSDGKRANIGSGCAKGETMEVQARLKSAVSAAKTRSRLAAELEAAKQDHAKAQKAWRDIEALTPPKAELVEETPDKSGRGDRQVWTMGDARVWAYLPGGFDSERRQTLLNGWRTRRYEEQGFKMSPYWFAQRVEDLEDRLKKIERKLGAMLY